MRTIYNNIYVLLNLIIFIINNCNIISTGIKNSYDHSKYTIDQCDKLSKNKR